jgi:hypothetical protein
MNFLLRPCFKTWPFSSDTVPTIKNIHITQQTQLSAWYDVTMEDRYKMFTIVIKNLLVKIPVPETTGIQKPNVKHNNKSM